MRVLRTLALAGSAAIAATTALPTLAQVDKPVRLLVGFAPGGSADIATRLVADRMKDELRQPSSSRTGPVRAAASSPRR